MNNNDEQIKLLLAKIEEKKKTLGKKPRATWLTNGVIDGTNLNTATVSKCVELAAKYLAEKKYVEEANTFLELQSNSSSNSEHVNNVLEDLKLRVTILKYEQEDKKLKAMEAQLKELRSQDLKTQDLLSEFSKDL